MFKRSLLILLFLLLTQQGLYAGKKVTEKELITAINEGVKSTEEFLKKVPTYQIYKDEKSILHYAVELKKYDVVEFLVSRVDLSLQGGLYYETALQDAIFYGNLRIAELLITSGTNLDIKNVDGDTALHIAAKYAHVDIMKMLIRAGATTNIRDGDGNTPKDLLPELMFEDRKELIKELEPVEEEHIPIVSQSKKIIIESIIGGVKSTTTIDTANKNIYQDSIDGRSKVQNSDIGIMID